MAFGLNNSLSIVRLPLVSPGRAAERQLPLPAVRQLSDRQTEICRWRAAEQAFRQLLTLRQAIGLFECHKRLRSGVYLTEARSAVFSTDFVYPNKRSQEEAHENPLYPTVRRFAAALGLLSGV